MHGLEKKMIDAGRSSSINDDAAFIDQWIDSFTKEIEEVNQHMNRQKHPCKIRRIHNTMRELDTKAYEPIILSIGPYHHGKPILQEVETIKRWYLNSILPKESPEAALKDYIKEMKAIEQKARSFYSNVEMESKDFVWMLLLDGLFLVIEFCGMPAGSHETHMHENPDRDADDHAADGKSPTFCGWARKKERMIHMMHPDQGENQVNSGTTEEDGRAPVWYNGFLPHDFFLLENQLPFFVLNKIYTLIYVSHKPFIDAMKEGVHGWLPSYTREASDLKLNPLMEVHHLLHLCYMFFFPSHAVPTNLASSTYIRVRNATELYEAGVSFRTNHGRGHSLLDITFTRRGTLVMPCIVVDDNTNSLLRNLMALEQMMRCPPHVCGYVLLLTQLITVPADVELLARRGIVQNHLSNHQDMVEFVNRLSVGIHMTFENEYSLKPVFEKLHRYTGWRIWEWTAWLKIKYFGNPWMFLSLLVAFLFLVLTSLQTFFQVYPYYRPSHHQ